MKSSEPVQEARQLDQAQIVHWVLVVPHQDGSALRQPTQGPLHHPATWLAPPRSPFGRALLADRPDMGDVAVSLGGLMARGIVVARIQAEMLPMVPGRGPFHDERL